MHPTSFPIKKWLFLVFSLLILSEVHGQTPDFWLLNHIQFPPQNYHDTITIRQKSAAQWSPNRDIIIIYNEQGKIKEWIYYSASAVHPTHLKVAFDEKGNPTQRIRAEHQFPGGNCVNDSMTWQYRYDDRGRMIEKKVRHSWWNFKRNISEFHHGYTYDERDSLVRDSIFTYNSMAEKSETGWVELHERGFEKGKMLWHKITPEANSVNPTVITERFEYAGDSLIKVNWERSSPYFTEKGKTIYEYGMEDGLHFRKQIFSNAIYEYYYDSKGKLVKLIRRDSGKKKAKKGVAYALSYDAQGRFVRAVRTPLKKAYQENTGLEMDVIWGD